MVHTGTERIETERLILRRFTLSDSDDAYLNWFSDPDAARYMRWEAHTDVSQTREFLNRVVSDYEKPDFYRWAVVLKSDKKAIGAVGLQVVSEYDSVADVSYVLGGAYRNRGIASEALRAVLGYAFTAVGVNRVEGYHSVNNPASGKVMLNAGMKYEGLALQKYRSRAGYEDCGLYAAVPDIWLRAESSDGITVRSVCEHDAAELLRLNAIFNGGDGVTEDSVARSIRENAGERVFVAEDRSGLIGFCCVHIFESFCYAGNYAQITELFVDEPHRRKGVAARLIAYAERFCSGLNIASFQLFTGRENVSAQRFYESAGYVGTDEIMYRKRNTSVSKNK